MKLIKLKQLNLPPIQSKRVVGLGLFEAMHIGHIKVVTECVELAKTQGLTSTIITFSKPVNKQGSAIFDINHRIEIIDSLGVDELVVIEMSTEIINTAKEEFIDFLLQMGTASAICGEDYRFGAGGSGTVVDLQQHFDVRVISYVKNDGVKISTSNIRSQLNLGNIAHVNQLLGYNYFITGKVEKGKQLGRKIGVPTANIYPQINLKRGVYLSQTTVGGVQYPSITNVGINPTVGGDRLSVETYIGNNFKADIYGEVIKVEFIEKIRDEQKFPSVELLVAQLKQDIKKMEEAWR